MLRAAGNQEGQGKVKKAKRSGNLQLCRSVKSAKSGSANLSHYLVRVCTATGDIAMSICSTALSDDERLLVRPRIAAHMLDVGVTHLYQLIHRGDIESFKDGAARKIVVASLKSYIERQIERSKAA
jgi:excisionase family DNA binding protein